MKRRIAGLASLTAFLAAAAFLVSAPASAGTQGVSACGGVSGGTASGMAAGTGAVRTTASIRSLSGVHLGGIHLVSGYSPGDQMEGSLKGTWNTEIDWSTFKYEQTTGVMTFRVNEVFSGSVDGVGGGPDDKIFFKGFVVQRFQPGTPLEATGADNWLGGQCVHPITGGQGALAGASGILYFRDIVFFYSSNYWGVIRL